MSLPVKPTPTWWQLARQPRWIAALLAALALAAGFALLGQWQLERSFREVGINTETETEVALESLVTPASPIANSAIDRLVRASVTLQPQQAFIIADRQQLLSDGTKQSGYWLVANSSWLYEDQAVSLTLALGFSPDLAEIEAARASLLDTVVPAAFLPVSGRFEPSEAPERPTGEKPYILNSLSVAQLINVYYTDEPPLAVAGFLIVDETQTWAELQPIRIGLQTEQVEINWLNLFYAAEWVIFAGFAVFLWWRLVEDERVRLALDASDEAVGSAK